MGWRLAGACLGFASELGLSSVLTRSALHRRRPSQAQSESKPRPNQVQSELRSHTEEIPNKRRGHRHGSRKDIEDSCVCTHAKAPARSGLGLALGLVVLLLCGIAKAQFHQPSEVTVRIGETLPESFFETVHQAVNMQTGEKATVRLADHRDKLIILDFWASWCGPCIHSLNKLDSLTRHDGDGYVVIPVTYQSIDEASRAYEKYGWHFNGIVGDTTLGKIFPHSGIPHMVWVKDGKVAAMPQTQFVTAESIGEMLDNRIPDIPMAKLIYNPTNPLSTDNESYSGKLLYTAELTAGDPRFQQQRLGLVHQDGMLILSGVNLPLVESLLFGAYRSSIAPGLGPHNGIVFETGDKVDSLLRMPRPLITQYDDPDDYRSAYETWVRTFRYSYRVAIPEEMGEDAAYVAMQQDIVRFIYKRFGLRVSIENRPDPVLVINQHETAN
ncbi:TlpA family protein disulfide reductase [Parapedobacter deserti]|uniref:TlpA family protein disulfide reductase n=1 Tax=Parapedobacter deserti TaxID=1912957 RepID=A0ABV7JHP3_9SPHI